MFREMRRSKQALSPEACGDILRNGSSGVLALSGDGDYPYAVPLSYVYDDGAIYFHSAQSGHKLDAIARNDKASFCVIDKDQVVPKEYTTYFRSVIAFGRIQVIEDADEKLTALKMLAAKYSPGQPQDLERDTITGSLPRVSILKLTTECVTGKEAIELTRSKT